MNDWKDSTHFRTAFLFQLPYARYIGRLTTRQVALVAVMALLAVAGYFVVRSYAGGASFGMCQW